MHPYIYHRTLFSLEKHSGFLKKNLNVIGWVATFKTPAPPCSAHTDNTLTSITFYSFLLSSPFSSILISSFPPCASKPPTVGALENNEMPIFPHTEGESGILLVFFFGEFPPQRGQRKRERARSISRASAQRLRFREGQIPHGFDEKAREPQKCGRGICSGIEERFMVSHFCN